MWRSLGHKSLKKIKFLSSDSCSISHKSLVGFHDSLLFGKIRSFGDSPCGVSRFWPDQASYQTGGVHRFCSGHSINNAGSFGNCRGVASAAEAVVSTEDESDEVQELINQMAREIKVVKQPKLVGEIAQGKYYILRRRQIKMETEAWQEAAKEYQELVEDMCEQKLAPNLPYMKSLFLGWFEPLKNAIAADQESCVEGRHKTAYGPYFDQLPATMMAVITMHKLMGLLMTGVGSNSGCKVVHAACQIGEAIEHEVGSCEVFSIFYLLICCSLASVSRLFNFVQLISVFRKMIFFSSALLVDVLSTCCLFKIIQNVFKFFVRAM